MARKIIKRLLPDNEVIRNHKSLQIFGAVLHDPNLWHINRRSTSLAFFIGLFVAFIPVPAQMLLSGLAAVWLRANLPISVLLVWITNPLTMPPMFFTSFKVGCWILNVPPRGFDFELSLQWFTEGIADIWQPFLLGSVVCGLLAGLAGAAFIRLFWRLHVVQRWQQRKRWRASER